MAEDTMLQEAIGAIRNGDTVRARDLLTRLIKTNANNADYWLWMSAVVETIKERTYCLQEALRRDPANPSIRRGLVMIGALPPEEIPVQNNLVRRNWQPYFAEPELKNSIFTRQSAPRVFLGIGAGVIMVGLIAMAIWGVRGPAVAMFSRKPAAFTTPKPTATYLITGTSVVRSPTPTFVGPTPLWMFLSETYTPTPFYVNTPHPRTEAYRSGIRALQRADWKAVISFMQQVVVSEPNAADAYYYMGESYRQLDDCETALPQYDQAIKTNPNFAPAYLARARCNFIQDPKFDIQPDLDRAIQLDPNLADAWLEEARIALAGEDVKTAMQKLDAASTLVPGSPQVYLLRAQADLLNGQAEDAIDDASQANQLDITLLDSYRILGEAYQADQQLELSVKPLETYTRYVQDNPEAWVMLGRGYHAQNKDDLAMDAFSQALKLNNRLIEAFLVRGQIFLDEGDAKKAMDDMASAVQLDAKSFPANLGKGRAYLDLGYPGDAYLAIDRGAAYAQTDEEKANLYYWRAKSLDAIGRLDASKRDWLALQALPKGSVSEECLEEARLRLKSTATVSPSAMVTSTTTATPRPPKASVTPTRKKP